VAVAAVGRMEEWRVAVAAVARMEGWPAVEAVGRMEGWPAGAVGRMGEASAALGRTAEATPWETDIGTTIGTAVMATGITGPTATHTVAPAGGGHPRAVSGCAAIAITARTAINRRDEGYLPRWRAWHGDGTTLLKRLSRPSDSPALVPESRCSVRRRSRRAAGRRLPEIRWQSLPQKSLNRVADNCGYRTVC
jgi:hypothetical protein